MRGSRRWLALMLVAAGCLVSRPSLAEPSVSVLPLGFAVGEMRGPESRVAVLAATTDALRDRKDLAGQPLVVVWGAEGAAVIVLRASGVETIPLALSKGDLAVLEQGRAAIPGSRLQNAGPLTVTLTDPVAAAGSGELGFAAGSVTVSERKPVPPGPDPKPVPSATERVGSGEGAVFEDRAPRLVDLDGDGTPEILTVLSDAVHGSSMAVIAKREGRWSVTAGTPPTGQGGPWLNPAAVADFAGIGRPQIALVRSPNQSGALEIWSYESGRLVKRAERPGYSNHAPGSDAQDLAAVVQGGDARPALAIPTQDRAGLALLTVGDAVAERWRVPLPSKALTGVAALGAGRETHILVGLEDGRIADIRP